MVAHERRRIRSVAGFEQLLLFVQDSFHLVLAIAGRVAGAGELNDGVSQIELGAGHPRTRRVEEAAVALENRHGHIQLQLLVIGFDLDLLVVSECEVVFLRLLQKAMGEAAADQVAHVGNGAFVSRHEDEVVLEFADLAIGSLVLENLGNIRRRLTQIRRYGSRFVIHYHEQRARVADFVRHFIRAGRRKHGVEFPREAG